MSAEWEFLITLNEQHRPLRDRALKVKMHLAVDAGVHLEMCGEDDADHLSV